MGSKQELGEESEPKAPELVSEEKCKAVKTTERAQVSPGKSKKPECKRRGDLQKRIADVQVVATLEWS